MTASEGFSQFLEDQLGGLGRVTVRRMFGGAGVFCDGVMFALIANDTLYLKADAAGAPAFEAEGMGPFEYEKAGGKSAVMSYWQAPERLFDEPDELLDWARKALAVAHAAKPAKTSAPGRTQRKRRRS